MDSPANVIDLEKYVQLGIQESLHLDYKDSRALAKKQRDEIVKDVSSFANADGGVLIFGIKEKDHLPESLDEGVLNQEISREWIDQILQANITPPISGIEIHQIPKNKTNSYYVVKIPKSYRGPHQASDKKYYKRYNFKSSPMDHYEIQDVASRREILPGQVSLDIKVEKLFFKLVCTNIGNDPVKNVVFSFSPNLEWPRGEMPQALKQGINYFPVGKKLGFLYCTTNEAYEQNSKIQTKFEVTVTYSKADLNQPISEIFNFDLSDFVGTSVEMESADVIVRAIDRGFSTLRDAIDKIGRQLK